MLIYYNNHNKIKINISFLIKHIEAGSEDEHIGKIVKIWGGFGNEILGAHQFEVEFPPKADATTKVILTIHF